MRRKRQLTIYQNNFLLFTLMSHQTAGEGREKLPIPSVFISVATLNRAYGTREPENIEECRKNGLKAPDFCQYNINNNVVALCDDKGNIHCALGDASTDGNRKNMTALDALESEGKITKGNFYVPQFGSPYKAGKDEQVS